MASSVRWYGNVFREDGHVLRRVLDFRLKVKEMETEVDMKKSGCGRKCEGWFENGRCTLPIKVECWRNSDCCWVEGNLATLWDTTRC